MICVLADCAIPLRSADPNRSEIVQVTYNLTACRATRSLTVQSRAATAHCRGFRGEAADAGGPAAAGAAARGHSCCSQAWPLERGSIPALRCEISPGPVQEEFLTCGVGLLELHALFSAQIRAPEAGNPQVSATSPPKLRDREPSQVETAWAPKWVGDELRQVRAAAWEARLAGLRAGGEASAAQQRGDHQEAERKQELAGSYRALHDAYRQRETVFAATMADRDDWEKATVQQRHLAVAADAELRRRHPGEHYPPLRSAEPEPVTIDQREELTMTAREEARETGQWIKDLAVAHRTFVDRLADRLSLKIPSRNPDYDNIGQAFPPWPGPDHHAILQPPKPEIRPSLQTLQRAADSDADFEAAD
jgi:hypothetical protein